MMIDEIERALINSESRDITHIETVVLDKIITTDRIADLISSPYLTELEELILELDIEAMELFDDEIKIINYIADSIGIPFKVVDEARTQITLKMLYQEYI